MKQSIKKFIRNSPTRTLLLEKLPEGTKVSMSMIEDMYVELSPSTKPDESKKARARHVYLRLVDDGVWRGSTEPYVKVMHGEGIFEWAKRDSIHLGRGVRRVKGKTLRFETVSGKMQSIGVDKVHNLAELVEATKYVKTENR